MLHLIFNEKGIERLHEILRPTDQVVQFYRDRIILVDIAKYLKQLNHNNKINAGDAQIPIEGEVINQRILAGIIEKAPSIKSTY